jgi:hypothetical protein
MGRPHPVPLITLSAPYGAGGSQIGPALARRLDLPFLDRAIPTTVAQRLALPLQQALARDESTGGALERLLLQFAPAVQFVGGAAVPNEATMVGERTFLSATEQVIRERAAAGGGVILGRAAAVVLRDHPHALHVRLRGPRERRIAQAMHLEGIDRREAQHRLEHNDRAREAYVRHFYRADPNDPALYRLVLDSTTFTIAASVEIIAAAALQAAAAA